MYKSEVVNFGCVQFRFMLDTVTPVVLVIVELSVVEQRYQAVLEVLNNGATVTDVARRYGVARQTVHEWLRRYASQDLAGLVDGSARPLSCPHQMPAEVEARIIALRREHEGWGPRSIGHQLSKERVRNSSVKQWTDKLTGMRNTLLSLDPVRDAELWTAVNAKLASLRQADGTNGTPREQLQVDAFIGTVATGDAVARVPQVGVLIDYQTNPGLHRPTPVLRRQRVPDRARRERRSPRMNVWCQTPNVRLQNDHR